MEAPLLRKLLFVTIGFIFAGLGFIGSLLPVLPTTPFLLIAAWAFARGSDRFNHWFHNTKLYQNHLESFVKNRSMKLKTKIGLVSFASTMMAISFFLTDKLFVRIFLVAMWLFLLWYFKFRIRTIR